MGWEVVYVLVVHPEQLLKLAKQQQYHNTLNCSRQLNATVPNQTTTQFSKPGIQIRRRIRLFQIRLSPYHTILQTAVSRGM